MIFVAVHDGDELELSFAGNVPRSAQFDTLKGQWTRFKVDALAVACVRRLGAAARQVPVPPDNPSMHFAGREVSEDLERLASHLARYLGIP
ncbi:MAG: hypothetical protein KUG77_05675 [Nannocystaceae bacterium]|nr:hypothetical protein [Nannocystaceae bacterium]